MNILKMAESRDLIARAKAALKTNSDLEVARSAGLIVAITPNDSQDDPTYQMAKSIIDALAAAPSNEFLAEVGQFVASFARIDADGPALKVCD